MTEEPETPPADPARLRAIARRLILPHVILTAVIVAAALWFVLYGMKGGDGKETQLAATGECVRSAELAPKLTPLVKGDIAALAINAAPRPMPALAFSGSGGSVDLSSFKGRVVLLNLWATWCVPCREEMPALDRLQGIAGNENFTVVTLNIDTARLERPKAFLQEIGVKNLAFYAEFDGQILPNPAAKRQGGRVADNFPDWS